MLSLEAPGLDALDLWMVEQYANNPATVAALCSDGHETVALAGCSLAKNPGHPGNNWVTRTGGLPDYICRVARAIHRRGTPIGSAIAIAVSRMRAWVASKHTHAGTKAKAAGATAEWEAKRAAAHTEHAAKESDKVAATVSGSPLDRVVSLAYSKSAGDPLLVGLAWSEEARHSSAAARKLSEMVKPEDVQRAHAQYTRGLITSDEHHEMTGGADLPGESPGVSGKMASERMQAKYEKHQTEGAAIRKSAANMRTNQHHAHTSAADMMDSAAQVHEWTTDPDRSLQILGQALRMVSDPVPTVHDGRGGEMPHPGNDAAQRVIRQHMETVARSRS